MVTTVQEGNLIRNCLLVSLGLHAAILAAAAALPAPRHIASSPLSVTVLPISPRVASTKQKETVQKVTAAKEKHPQPALTEKTRPARKPAAPKAAAKAANPTRVARYTPNALPFPGLRPRPPAPGSGTPAGPGHNPRDEASGGKPGNTRFTKLRPGVSFPDEQLSAAPQLPGGIGTATEEPLPRGLPIGRQVARLDSSPNLLSRAVGGSSRAIGAGNDANGGPRTDQAPETVFINGGAGGSHLPKARPRLGGGGSDSLLTAPAARSEERDAVGSGPGHGGGAGMGSGGGLGLGRGRGIGVTSGAYDIAALDRRPGTGIGAAAGSGVGTGTYGNGRPAAAGEMPGTGGNAGFGYGSGSGIGIGSGRGGGKARPGVSGIPFGDIGGAVTGGSVNGGGGKNGGPGGPGGGVQIARRGGGGSGTGSGGFGGKNGIWAGIGRGNGAGGHGIGPGTGSGSGAGDGSHPGSGSGTRGRGTEMPGGGGSGGGTRLGGYGKALPGMESGEEEILGRGFYPDGIIGYYYDDPDQHVDLSNPNSYLGKAIPAGSTFTHLVATRKDQRIDFNWNPRGEWGDLKKLQSPMEGIGNTYWSARWEGKLFVPKDDTYTFKFDPLDDGGRLYLRYRAGGPMVRVIDSWKVSSTRPESREYFMKRGAYDIRVEYAQRPEYFAAIGLQWKSSTFGWEVIGPYRSGGRRRTRH